MGKVFLRGKKWGINYTDPNGKQIRRMISPYKETAELVLKKVELDIVEGKYLDIKRAKPILFEEFLEEFLSNYVYLENKHPKNREGLIRKIALSFNGLYLHRIDSRIIRQYLSKLREESKPATVNRHLSMLRCLFNRAIDWKVISVENPTNGIKKLPEDNERRRYLSVEQQKRLLSHCKGHTKIIVLTALQTGLRWNEMMSLKWSESPEGSYIDFNEGQIVIHSSLSKSKYQRNIPMSYSLQCELFDLKKTTKSEYVFVSPKTGKPFNNIHRSFKRAVKEVGLRDFRFHDLRHVFASSLASKGMSLFLIQNLLGHTTPRTTQRYTHYLPNQLKDAIEEIDLYSPKSVV